MRPTVAVELSGLRKGDRSKHNGEQHADDRGDGAV